jgi:hypothetical protein
MASGSFLKGSVIAMPKKFSALNNSTIHSSLHFALSTPHLIYALRITLHAFNSQLATRNPQPISGLTPLLPINFTHYASRITLYASRFTHHESRPFSKIANFAVKSVKSRITNHAPDGYQMNPEVVII